MNDQEGGGGRTFVDLLDSADLAVDLEFLGAQFDALQLLGAARVWVDAGRGDLGLFALEGLCRLDLVVGHGGVGLVGSSSRLSSKGRRRGRGHFSELRGDSTQAALILISSQPLSMSLVDALRGQYGTVGLFSAVQRLFLSFVPCALAGSFLLGTPAPTSGSTVARHRSPLVAPSTDAPFGRFGTWGNALNVSGDWGWLLMEACSPLAFLWSLAAPLTTSPLSHWPPFSPSAILGALSALPPARKVLATLFLVHYANRSVIGTLRNPGRAPMHLVIPLLSALFNLANGGTLGAWLSAGGRAASTATGGTAGLKPPSSSSSSLGSSAPSALFCIGVGLWAAGFAGNIFHDEHLYALKRARRRSLAKGKAKASSSSGKPPAHDRYAIPTRGLYALVSHPSYLCEWLEWAGFLLAALQLAPAPFPSSSSTLSGSGSLRPFEKWYLQPPALFLLQEVAAMLPRARSGHRWYRETFGKEWEDKGARWAVLPGLY